MDRKTKNGTAAVALRGVRDGLPIGLGYFAVSFSLGIAAYNVGLSVIQGVVMSFLNHASAGEYAGLSGMRAQAPYWEMALLILIANARYVLMSCALSQKLPPEMGLGHRLLIGFGITDELFGIGIAYPGYLRPAYMYGAFITAVSMWAAGTACGIVAGNVLPPLVVGSLSAAIYGMFIAIVIPAGKRDRRALIVVLAGFALSSLLAWLPVTAAMSESARVIVLTVVISAAAAVLMPVADEEQEAAP